MTFSKKLPIPQFTFKRSAPKFKPMILDQRTDANGINRVSVNTEDSDFFITTLKAENWDYTLEVSNIEHPTAGINYVVNIFNIGTNTTHDLFQT